MTCLRRSCWPAWSSSNSRAGIDIGSLTAKSVILVDGRVVGRSLVPTGTHSERSGLVALEKALESAGLARQDLSYTVATGYGRISAPYADKTVTEISIHLAIAYRVAGMFSRIGIDREVFFSGGVAKNVGMKASLEGVLGARYISTKNCAFIRQCVGLFAQGEDPYIRSCNAVAVAATCLQIYRLAELIAHYFGVRTLVLGVPRNFTLPEGRRYFEQGMEELVRQLEGLAGRRLEEERLQEAIDLYAAIRRAILRLYRLQAGPEAPLSWRDLFEVLQAGFYLDRVWYLSWLEGLLAEVETTGAGDPGSAAGGQGSRGDFSPPPFCSSAPPLPCSSAQVWGQTAVPAERGSRKPPGGRVRIGAPGRRGRR